MKKIAIASAAMGGAALIAFGASGTFAAFSDSENLRGEAGAATLDLAVGDSAVPAAADAQNMEPGDTLFFPYFVANSGDLDGFLGLGVTLTDYEHSCSGDEYDVDSDCGQANAKGDFSRAATYTVTYTLGEDEADCIAARGDNNTPITNARIPANAPSSFQLPAVVPVASDFSACVVIGVTLPLTATNAVQGDSAALEVELRLEQLRGAVGGVGGVQPV